MAIVYMHTVLANNKKYVGQSTASAQTRWGANGHRYKGQYFYRAIEKYGWDNMKHEIIAENLSDEEADKLEKELIEKYKTNNRKYGYNITAGGRDGAGSPGGKNPNAHPLVCVETGQRWECLNYCAKDIGVNPSSIRESLVNGYRCCGLHFRYEEDEDYIPRQGPYKVRCVETGEIWNSVKECAEAVGKDKRTIAHYCRRERHSKDGLTYEYYVT